MFFSATKYLLTKRNSVDGKAYQLALGVPILASVELLHLDEFRQLPSEKYILRSSTITNSNDFDVSLKSDVDFPKRVTTISFLTSINSYTSDLVYRHGGLVVKASA